MFETALILFILGHAKVFDAREHPELVEKVLPRGGHGTKVVSVFIIAHSQLPLELPQFITPRHTGAEDQNSAAPVHQRIPAAGSQIQDTWRGAVTSC